MSKIEVDAIEPQSGTTLTVGAAGDTITVPSGVTLDTSNSTLTLPDNSVTTNKIADANITLAKLSATGTKDATTFLRGDNTFAEVPAGGITEADMWRHTTDISNVSVDPVSANLERVDNASFAKIGTGMSVSSGVWTFPSTGLYKVTYYQTANVTVSSKGITIAYSGDSGSTWDTLSYAYIAGTIGSGVATAFVNITNTSTQKVKFTIVSGSGNDFLGNTNYNFNSFEFIRLGDSQ